MCGIVGYIGKKEAYPIVMEGLKRLEYRGYDSAGIALYDGSELKLSKTKGKVADLEEKVNSEISKNGSVGIGHTRWATHGVPNDVNSHPHYSNSGDLVIIHKMFHLALYHFCIENTENGCENLYLNSVDQVNY